MSKRERQSSSGGSGKKKLQRQAGQFRASQALYKVTRTGGAPVNTHVTPSFQARVDKAVINEKKRNAHFVDLAQATYAMDTTGSITLVATIAQGASQSQRVGKKALYKSCQFRGICTSNTATVVADGACLLVYDRDPTGGLPNITDVLNTVTSASFNNDTNSDRFKIVRRWDFVFCGNTTAPSTGMEVHSFDHFVDMRNMEVQFGNLASGAIGDIKKGALYFITCGGNGPGTTAPVCTMGCRTRFIDLE